MSPESSSPLTQAEIVDAYFLEHRAKVLDVAAMLDRLDRATPDEDDFRIQALRDAIACLIDGEGDRVRRIQMRLSDRSTAPIDAAPMQGAFGAPRAEDPA